MSQCAKLLGNGTMRWIGRWDRTTLGNVVDTLRTHRGMYKLTKGIWCGGIQKASFLLWRIRWRHLPTFDQLISRGYPSDPMCLLCGSSNESINHLFHNCEFSSWLLRKSLEAAGSIINPAQTHLLAELGAK